MFACMTINECMNVYLCIYACMFVCTYDDDCDPSPHMAGGVNFREDPQKAAVPPSLPPGPFYFSMCFLIKVLEQCVPYNQNCSKESAYW